MIVIINVKVIKAFFYKLKMKIRTILMYTMIVFFALGKTVSADPNIMIKQILAGLTKPVAITHAGDGSGRLFITLQGRKNPNIR